LGNLLFARGRRGEAVDAWFKAVDRDPGLVPAWENLRRQQLLDNCPFEVLLTQAPEGVVPPPPVPAPAREEPPAPRGDDAPPPDEPSPETPPPVVEPMVTMEVAEDVEPTMYEEESSVDVEPPSDSSDEETLEGSAAFDEMEELTLEGEPPPPE
jgi:hypothetical protein